MYNAKYVQITTFNRHPKKRSGYRKEMCSFADSIPKITSFGEFNPTKTNLFNIMVIIYSNLIKGVIYCVDEKGLFHTVPRSDERLLATVEFN